MHGHAIDVGKDECSAGHISLFKSIKCPIASCGFQSEPRYAHVDIPLDQSYHEVKVHFKSVHGAQLTIFIVLAVVLLGGIAHANEGGGGGGGGGGAGVEI